MATPADLSAIYNLLREALSQEEPVRKAAEGALNGLESRAGFCSCLMEIISARELDAQTDARWLAAVYFKNSVKKYWRPNHPSGILDSEKSYLRAKLLDQLSEENNQIAVQVALIVAKVARFDYPKAWPELFPDLIKKLEGASTLVTQRVYLVLSQILKELSTKRLVADQRTFAQITAQLFEHTWQHWCSDTQAIITALSSIVAAGHLVSADELQTVSLRCERWLLCLKCIRRMLVFGFPSDAKTVQEVPAVSRVVPALLEAIRPFVSFWVSLQGQSAPLRNFVEKASLKIMKTLTSTQSTHPYTFSSPPCLVPTLDYCYNQVAEANTSGQPLFEPFVISCMVLLQAILKCIAYRHDRTGRVLGIVAPSAAELKGQLAERAQQALQAYFNNGRLAALCTILIQRYFTLTPADLEEWGRDPEAFHQEQDMAQWTDKLRPCAEALFLSMLEDHKEVLAPLLLDMLRQSSEACPPPSTSHPVAINPALLYKEACYNAVGLANYDLEERVDFNGWYQSTLAFELSNQHPNGRVLRRRVAWLIGRWVAKVKDDLRRPVYEALVKLLQENDSAVQLAAINSLRSLIDDMHFCEKDFGDLVEPCLQLLFQFMHTCAEFESQLQIFNLVSLIIERIGNKIVPYAERIMAFLPEVWQHSEGQSMLRIQVMLAFQRLVIALGPQSPSSYSLLLPILRYSTDVTQPDELNMLEDGMQLWQATLRQAPAMTPELMSLFSHLEAVMERSFDHLPVAMRILESYILLGGPSFLQLHAQGVAKILESVVGNVKEKGMAVTLPIIDLLIQCFPAEAPPLLDGALQKLLAMVTGGQKEPDTVKAASAVVLARVLLQNTPYFVEFAVRGAEQIPPPVLAAAGNPVLAYVDVLLDKFDSIAAPPKRKLAAMGLCVVLGLKGTQVLERLEQILSVCTGLLHELDGDRESIAYGYDYSGGIMGNGTDEYAGDGESTRRRQVYEADPVNKLSLGDLLKEKLQACGMNQGQEAFNAAMARCYPHVVQQLRQFING